MNNCSDVSEPMSLESLSYLNNLYVHKNTAKNSTIAESMFCLHPDVLCVYVYI
jgi:hypothetical protein